MKKTRLLILLIGLVAIAAIIYNLAGTDAVTVKLVKPEIRDIETSIRVTGHVINDKTVTMTALVNGQIEGMLVQKGERVEADQVLAFFDKREADATVAKTDAVVGREEQAVIESQAKYKRLKNVKSSGGSSQQIIDDAEAEMNAAKARLRVAKAELRVAQINREKIELRSPFAGVITEKTTDKGQWMEAGTKIFTLVGSEGREIEVKVDAGDSGTVQLGQTVNITCDAFPGKVWQEKIHWIAPSIVQDEKNESLNTFAVRISLGENAPPLLLGQQVDAHIVIASKKQVHTLPFTALRGEQGKYEVAVLNSDTVKFKSVTTGIESDTHIEILSDLSDDDQVVISTGKPLTEGQQVIVQP